jgi:hypothetical protein
MLDNKTQKEFVLKVLLEQGEISRNFCLRNYISRLGAVIYSLKHDGYVFTTFVRENLKPDGRKGKDFVYKLVKEDEQTSFMFNVNVKDDDIDGVRV